MNKKQHIHCRKVAHGKVIITLQELESYGLTEREALTYLQEGLNNVHFSRGYTAGIEALSERLNTAPDPKRAKRKPGPYFVQKGKQKLYFDSVEDAQSYIDIHGGSFSFKPVSVTLTDGTHTSAKRKPRKG